MKNTTELIERIVHLLNSNFDVYVHRKTAKITAIPASEDFLSFVEAGDDRYEMQFLEIDSHPLDYYKAERLNSRELYNLMMDFTDELERAEGLCLVHALRTSKPYEEFHKELNKLDSSTQMAWQHFFSTQLNRIYRNRLCREHIHLHQEPCS
ncbi:hypothetical protein [Carboxylicivirga sp. M1479]|uniref:hypothetical protein n=1 Tax=Carboxylicivirga sp. M1479 TaxID=2594476 RepID=UPI00117814C4|nr:hypothetical protein [Carboxylicivirga sp. M1479]TRX71477.1 hypothetical protein FNN09_05775 [Carboxylicivirga sp. M1479]